MIYGYQKSKISDEGLLEMKEISFAVNADALEKVAKFLAEAANDMRSGKIRPGGHVHIDRVMRDWEKVLGADIIVCAPEKAKANDE